jgi:hypothetical protein
LPPTAPSRSHSSRPSTANMPSSSSSSATSRTTRSLRRRLLAPPGRLTHHERRWTLHLPARWPWQTPSSRP